MTTKEYIKTQSSIRFKRDYLTDISKAIKYFFLKILQNVETLSLVRRMSFEPCKAQVCCALQGSLNSISCGMKSNIDGVKFTALLV